MHTQNLAHIHYFIYIFELIVVAISCWNINVQLFKFSNNNAGIKHRDEVPPHSPDTNGIRFYVTCKVAEDGSLRMWVTYFTIYVYRQLTFLSRNFKRNNAHYWFRPLKLDTYHVCSMKIRDYAFTLNYRPYC